ncbi:FAD-dependent oxidoreductase [Synechococcus sp. PCC 6312]|uniref:FAD-dependent oxidoreductase n=1 Tax=Synechococcus sp. (strain ATCC 27167 / PCC 6312) TaxID=195253 RepID=UPI00029ECA07|nr:FAD-dependent oxidoreductase [Synechococcus sp. PCC 6312]AFY60139.1 2-polyprenyl-6-methoxyphenol hydroxylase-like oxidoreductase [Synechococcus sp. PCC 6312]
MKTDCCIVGGGPAGVILSLLLARQGIDVTLLEKQRDFDRDFRGDTLHPPTLELLDHLGLATELLQHPHSKLDHLALQTPGHTIEVVSFRNLKTQFPFVVMIPQATVLDFLIQKARAYPNFHLELGANVQELIQTDGVVQGVKYRQAGQSHEITALLTVAADGRFSQVRQLLGLQPLVSSPPMDVLWFRVPRLAGDEAIGVEIRTGGGKMLVVLERLDHWQLGLTIPKGSYQALRHQGIRAVHDVVNQLAPELAGARLKDLQNWSDIAFLAVESSYLKQWYVPGLVLIGDAAHVMSPVAGVGINYAIQDAMACAKYLTQPLKSGQITTQDLGAIQKQRFLPVRLIQTLQAVIQKQIISPALQPGQSVRLPLLLKLPLVKQLLAHVLSYGLWPVQPEN